jgi:hypothetical protein
MYNTGQISMIGSMHGKKRKQSDSDGDAKEKRERKKGNGIGNVVQRDE